MDRGRGSRPDDDAEIEAMDTVLTAPPLRRASAADRHRRRPGLALSPASSNASSTAPTAWRPSSSATRSEAEDAVHDAAVSAWAGFRSLRDPARFEAWFSRILVNGCRDRLRRRKRTPIVDVSALIELVRDDPPRRRPRERERRSRCGLARPRSTRTRAPGRARPPLLARPAGRRDRRATRHPGRDGQVAHPQRPAPPARSPRRRTTAMTDDEQLEARLRDALEARDPGPTAPRELRDRISRVPSRPAPAQSLAIAIDGVAQGVPRRAATVVVGIVAINALRIATAPISGPGGASSPSASIDRGTPLGAVAAPLTLEGWILFGRACGVLLIIWFIVEGVTVRPPITDAGVDYPWRLPRGLGWLHQASTRRVVFVVALVGAIAYPAGVAAVTHASEGLPRILVHGTPWWRTGYAGLLWTSSSTSASNPARRPRRAFRSATRRRPTHRPGCRRSA